MRKIGKEEKTKLEEILKKSNLKIKDTSRCVIFLPILSDVEVDEETSMLLLERTEDKQDTTKLGLIIKNDLSVVGGVCSGFYNKISLSALVKFNENDLEKDEIAFLDEIDAYLINKAEVLLEL